jgi:hypothetical protein
LPSNDEPLYFVCGNTSWEIELDADKQQSSSTAAAMRNSFDTQGIQE